MTWNFHEYYTNNENGLMGKLVLSANEKKQLINLRQVIRWRTKEVFEEAKNIASSISTLENIEHRLINTKLIYLSKVERNQIAKLIYDMDEDARQEFLDLTPRFWTQGSFQYDTLNRPFHPGQEMDIDDGTYMPMPIFEAEPKIGHSLLLLLVDSSLKSLVAEYDGWIYEAKQTCGRIKIPSNKTHIDVPMYAIPKDQFLQKQTAMAKCRARVGSESIFESYAMDSDDTSYEVDTKHVNLALRDGSKKWLNSDPKIVEDWFNDSCIRIGQHLREVCRFMKAWRDAQWEVGGPSSISLMAATVNVMVRVSHDSKNMGETMKIVAEHLPEEFKNGIESPDSTDEKPLFPPFNEHGSREKDIMEKLNKLHNILLEAEVAESKQNALSKINKAFGQRVSDHNIIISEAAAPVFRETASTASAASKISSTMVSG
ncbi:TPA: hypothetical protein P2M84_003141 [Aeromonas salmonicida]|nr:hypothetical protein [Aeromonas salmonicida]